MVGFYRLEVHIPGALSLKEKRFVIKSIKEKLKNKFNVSVAELAGEDKWQKSLIGIAMVSKDRLFIEKNFSRILNMIDADSRVEVVDRSIEYF